MYVRPYGGRVRVRRRRRVPVCVGGVQNEYTVSLTIRIALRIRYRTYRTAYYLCERRQSVRLEQCADHIYRMLPPERSPPLRVVPVQHLERERRWRRRVSRAGQVREQDHIGLLQPSPRLGQPRLAPKRPALRASAHVGRLQRERLPRLGQRAMRRLLQLESPKLSVPPPRQRDHTSRAARQNRPTGRVERRRVVALAHLHLAVSLAPSDGR